MIAASVVEEVRRLLAEGHLSQRKIARITGVSRGTVGAIASGKRADREPLRRVAGDGFPEPVGPLRRCRGCGGMVYMPCRLCRTRAQRNGPAGPPTPAWPARREEPLGLDFRGEDRARYERLRAQKAIATAPARDFRAERTERSPEKEDDDLGEAFEMENGLWEMDPADLWDALEVDDDEPGAGYESGYDLGLACER